MTPHPVPALQQIRRFFVEGTGPLGRLPNVHGSKPAPAEFPTRRRPDLVDVGILLLPVVLAVLVFVLANLV